MDLLTILLLFVGWAICGGFAIYLVGVMERFTSFRSEDDSLLFVGGPVSILLVIVVFIMMLFEDKFGNITKRLKNAGKGK